MHRLMSLAALVPGLALAQMHNPDITRLQSYVLGSRVDEAAVRELLASKPQLARAKVEGQPLLWWALDDAGVKGEVGEKAKKLASMLLDAGADPDAADPDGKPALVRYAMFARLEPMKVLIAHRAKVDARDREDSRTALHWVALLDERGGHEQPQRMIDAGQLLLDAKADVNAKDKRGATPLHAAAFLGNFEFAKFLVAHGADVNAVDARGYSVLGAVRNRLEEKFASAKEKARLPKVVKLLEVAGARDVRPKP